jgi:hypothetical protein
VLKKRTGTCHQKINGMSKFAILLLIFTSACFIKRAQPVVNNAPSDVVADPSKPFSYQTNATATSLRFNPLFLPKNCAGFKFIYDGVYRGEFGEEDTVFVPPLGSIEHATSVNCFDMNGKALAPTSYQIP